MNPLKSYMLLRGLVNSFRLFLINKINILFLIKTNMKKITSGLQSWLYVLLYLAFLVGLIYMIRLVTPLPYILIVASILMSYLIYKGKVTAIAFEDASSFIAMFFMVICIGAVAFLVKPNRYNTYIAKNFIPGKNVTKIVTVEADEGSNTWKERRTYWQPKTATGEILMDILGWFNFAVILTSFILWLKLYSRSKMRENQLKGKSKYDPD